MKMGLRAAREASGKTQAQVAEEVGISEVSYQRIEYGEQTPRFWRAIRIAKVLNKDTGDMETLFGEEQQSAPGGNPALDE